MAKRDIYYEIIRAVAPAGQRLFYFCAMKLSLLYQDESLLVVDKPPGLLSVPDRYHPELPNLIHALNAQLNRVVLPVHRLDRPTSGLIMVALTTDAQRELSRQLAEREPHKTYLALVAGRLAQPVGLIDQPIGPHPSKLGQMQVTPKGKAAQT
ncbi:MAG: hypothetical protein HC821_04145, partial [Lewinella sp.]|nr:hypothetical protein [Lewinella sp.]